MRNSLYLIYYRPQTKFEKVMFSQVSVCPRGRGGEVDVCPDACWDTPPWAGTPPGRYTTWQVYPPGQIHLPGRYTPWSGILPPMDRYAPTLHIPLECVLVYFEFRVAQFRIDYSDSFPRYLDIFLLDI